MIDMSGSKRTSRPLSSATANSSFVIFAMLPSSPFRMPFTEHRIANDRRLLTTRPVSPGVNVYRESNHMFAEGDRFMVVAVTPDILS